MEKSRDLVYNLSFNSIFSILRVFTELEIIDLKSKDKEKIASAKSVINYFGEQFKVSVK